MSEEGKVVAKGLTKEGKQVIILDNGKVIVIEKEKKINTKQFFNIFKMDKTKREPYKIEVIIGSDKVVEFYPKFIDNKVNNTFESDGKVYEINKDSLLKMDLTMREQLNNFISHFNIFKLKRFTKIKEKFAIYFEKDNVMPHTFDYSEPKVSSKLVFVARHSTVTTRGIQSIQFNEGFKLPLNAKTFIMIAIIVVIGIVAFYGYQQGWFANLKI